MKDVKGVAMARGRSKTRHLRLCLRGGRRSEDELESSYIRKPHLYAASGSCVSRCDRQLSGVGTRVWMCSAVPYGEL